MEYKVVSVIKGREYTDKFGPKVSYTLKLEGIEEAVEVSQKPSTTPPQAGDVLKGSIQDTQYGKKFKKEYTQAPQAQGGSKQFKADPDSRESIEWQTSVKAAVEIVRDFHSVNKMPEDLEEYTREIDTVAAHIKELINIKPKPVVKEVEPEVEEDDAPDKLQDPDLPPVELYE